MILFHNLPNRLNIFFSDVNKEMSKRKMKTTFDEKKDVVNHALKYNQLNPKHKKIVQDQVDYLLRLQGEWKL